MSYRGRSTLIGLTAFACLAGYSSSASQVSGTLDSNRVETVFIHGADEDTDLTIDGHVGFTLADSNETSQTFLFSGELEYTLPAGYKEGQRGVWGDIIRKIIK